MPVRRVGRLALERTVDSFFAGTEQVAFYTGNAVPCSDFSADPLLQGHNFSHLDTQPKRLGSPNFRHIPVNGPRCPVMNFQQDGHMAMHNPSGRANYESNTWAEQGGPREDPERGLTSYLEPVEGEERRTRSETFADHYGQACPFFMSQEPVEQKHIAVALTVELNECRQLPIRMRMVSHLRNTVEDLETVAGAVLDDDTHTSPGRRSMAGRPCSTTRLRCSSATMRQPSSPRMRRRGTSSPTRSRTADIDLRLSRRTDRTAALMARSAGGE